MRYSFAVLTLVLGFFVAGPALASAATLYVEVDVRDTYNNDIEENDFTISVSGEDVSDRSFRGSSSRKKITLDEGDYRVRVSNTRGYDVRYSSGCDGEIDNNDTEDCTITISDDRSPQYYSPGYQYPVYTPPVTLQKGYIPALPSTGFPPVSAAALAFAVVLLLGAGVFLYPYARYSITAFLR